MQIQVSKLVGLINTMDSLAGYQLLVNLTQGHQDLMPLEKSMFMILW